MDKANDKEGVRQQAQAENSVMSDTPWTRRSARQKADAQEARNAKLPGGKKQINSGRTWHSKRDNKLGGYMVEARTTDSNRYCITRSDWEGLIRDAHKGGMLPAMQIDIGAVQALCHGVVSAP